MASPEEGQCTALNVSDEKRCDEIATSLNGLFCAFHYKQCQGLYRGYKRRNANLDGLSASPPQYFVDLKTPLVNQFFTDVDSEELCQEIHNHLFLKLQLLERVIRARKLHHSRFFSMNYDYGHAKYLDQLQNERNTVTKALERIERRTAEILYKNQKWFKWVRQCQDDEEAHREKEQKKVKQEAALFRRHWKEVQERLKELRAKEDIRKQNAFLEKVYKERLVQQEDQEEDMIDWDPIEDVLGDKRGNLIGKDLIKRFLWMMKSEDDGDMNEPNVSTESKEAVEKRKARDGKEDGANEKEDFNFSIANKPTTSDVLEAAAEKEPNGSNEEQQSAPSKKSKAKRKKTKKKNNSQRNHTVPSSAAGPSDIKVVGDSNGDTTLASSESAKSQKEVGGQALPQESNEALMETREEMYDRLKNGSELKDDNIVGLMLAGTIENPVISRKTITFPDNEIEILLTEVSEIKHLLFCRLLLGHAALLPAALRADSVEAFLQDPEVTESDLRDLCLKMERPALQEIRDACADLFRSEEDDENDNHMNENEKNSDENKSNPMNQKILKPKKPKGALPDRWKLQREKARDQLGGKEMRQKLIGENGGTVVDFGKIKDDAKFYKKNIRVKICGRNIWNYPSLKAMNRKGWLHFCIIAKDCSLYDAVGLCRHWDEFFELNILSIWHYFPGADWATWVGNRWRQQFLELGFIVYFESSHPDAREMTQRHQAEKRGQTRRYAVLEARNFICAHIKRDDPVSRRFIQYVSMQSHNLLLLVRDAESGRILAKPPEEERWLFRGKSGSGRASKGDWNIIREIGPQFFEEMDRYRKWIFGFNEIYDVYIWDMAVGEGFPALFNAVQEMLIKANRCCSAKDLYNLAAPVLKTLTRKTEDRRVRDIKPGQQGVESLYDEFNHEGSRFFFGELETLQSHKTKNLIPQTDVIYKKLFYNEADALEDQILFPDEDGSNSMENIGPLKKWEDEGLPLWKFVEGIWDSDSDGGDNFDSEKIDDEEWEDEDEDEDKHVTADEARADTAGQIQALPENTRNSQGQDLLNQLMINYKPVFSERSPAQTRRNEKADFEEFVDREKARIFKEVWHKADLEPHAKSHYTEMKEMAKKSRAYNARGIEDGSFAFSLELINALDATHTDGKDVSKAIAKLNPFFDSGFLESEHGQGFRESLLLKQEERAKLLPDVRSPWGSEHRPKEFWKEWDEIKRSMKNQSDTPFEWQIAVRPIIAQLYKAGVIRTQTIEYAVGQTLAIREPNRTSSDLFIDFRSLKSIIQLPPTMQNPFSIPPLRTTARAFSEKHPKARFALLRLWSAPHFYPLSNGWETLDKTSFWDLNGRNFMWMFVPKDMPYSEWSMHHASRRRILPFAKLFGDRVVVKRNAFLVMGTNEQDLMRLAMATTYAIERRPWRWEVDLWKSFVNVNIGFLEALQDEWLEETYTAGGRLSQ